MKLLGIFLFCGVFAWGAVAYGADYGFFVKEAEVIPASQGGYVLNADIDYQFSPRANDALKNGVPLTLILKVRVNRYRRLIWNKTVFRKNMIYRLSYHALRKRYRIYDESQGVHRYFVNLPAAVEAMGKIRDVLVLDSGGVQPDTKYDANIKVYLDIESLPLPLRSVAYLIPQWHISSGWYKWSLDVLNHR